MLSAGVNDFLKTYDLKGPNFEDTPRRVSKMWDNFFKGDSELDIRTFPLQGPAGMIIFKDHEDWGFCPHHLLPVKYNFKIGYIPRGEVLGASKPLRIASKVLRSLPLQEDIGEEIVNTILKFIDVRGAGVVIKGEHLCMRMRGIESPCSSMITTFMYGDFLHDQSTREEFLLL